jgi:hypothetical protein
MPATVNSLASPAAAGSAESHLSVGPHGEVVMSWLEPEGGGHALRFSVLTDSAWTAAQTVATGDNWFVNWADFPSVVPITAGLWAAHWLVRQPAGGYAYDIAMSLSADGGRTWGAPFSPHRDGTPTEHGFATLFPWRDGVGVVWLDGRQTAGESAGHAPHGGEGGGMSLRAAIIGADGVATHESVIDSLTCDCCQTDATIGADGPVVVYRDRTRDEIRDIYAARAIEGRWTQPAPVAGDDWRIDACPVNGPAIAARGSDVVVAWFTAASDRPRVQLSWSHDGGGVFLPPVEVDADAARGRVGVALLPDGDAAVSWLRSSGADGSVAVRRVRPDGGLGLVRIVGQTVAARPGGVPQLVVSDGKVVLSWTEVEGEASRVQSAWISAVGL